MNSICERCKWARGCSLRPVERVAGRTTVVVCVDRRGVTRAKPALASKEICNPQDRWEDYSIYGSKFDPYEDGRNEAYGEERLEFPHTRLQRWMDKSEHVYNNMLAMGRRIREPSSEFERACKVLAHLKSKTDGGWVHINDIRIPMDWVDRRLRKYELARYYKNQRIEPQFRMGIERFLQELLLESLGVPTLR